MFDQTQNSIITKNNKPIFLIKNQRRKPFFLIKNQRRRLLGRNADSSKETQPDRRNLKRNQIEETEEQICKEKNPRFRGSVVPTTAKSTIPPEKLCKIRACLTWSRFSL